MSVLRSLCMMALAGVMVLPLGAPAQNPDDKTECRIIYVPTEQEVVEKMLDMAQVNHDLLKLTRSVNQIIALNNKVTGKNEPSLSVHDVVAGKSRFLSDDVKTLAAELSKRTDIVYDLGCGDGRIVCTAAKKYGAKGVGVDIDPARIRDCMETMKKFEVTKEQVEIRQGDALKVKDLEKATVITFYMLPEFMEKLEPQVLKRLKPGTRLVAHDYWFPNIKADHVIEFKGPSREHTLYMWTVRKP